MNTAKQALVVVGTSAASRRDLLGGVGGIRRSVTQKSSWSEALLLADGGLALPVLIVSLLVAFALGLAVRRRRARSRTRASGKVGGFGIVLRVVRRLVFRGPHRVRAAGYLSLLVFALVAANATAVAQSFAQREYMSALALRDRERFGCGLAWALALLAICSPARCLAEFAAGGLGMAWRDALTDGLLDEYFRPQVVYWMRRDGEVEDPDARIAIEAGHFADAAVLMARDIVENTLKLLGFIGVVFTISRRLCAVMTSYALVGALGTVVVFGRPLVSLDREIRTHEAKFRASLARCRERAEPLAFARGEAAEAVATRQRYEDLRQRQWLRTLWRTGLASFRDIFSWAAYLLPLTFVAPLWLRGEVQFGTVSQTVTAFQASLNALSVVVRKFRSVSSLVAEGGRLEALAVALGRAAAAGALNAPGPVVVQRPQEPGLGVSDLSLWLPSGTNLCTDLTFRVEPGQRMLVSGGSGVGKTTLIRALAGLWRHGSGRVNLPTPTIFLSQETYIPEGSLRRVLSFPADAGTYSDAVILDAAHRAHLRSVLERFSLDQVEDWEAVLSRGEQQRCGICRAFLVGPALLVLDEATSALDVPREAALYEALKAPCMLTVSHRKELQRHHSHVLRCELDEETGHVSWSCSALS